MTPTSSYAHFLSPRYRDFCFDTPRKGICEVAERLEKTGLGREVRMAANGRLHVKSHKALFPRASSRAIRQQRARLWWEDRLATLAATGATGGTGARAPAAPAPTWCGRVRQLAFRPRVTEALTLRGVHVLALVKRVVDRTLLRYPTATQAQIGRVIDAVINTQQDRFPLGERHPACAFDAEGDPWRDALDAWNADIDAAVERLRPPRMWRALQSPQGGRENSSPERGTLGELLKIRQRARGEAMFAEGDASPLLSLPGEMPAEGQDPIAD